MLQFKKYKDPISSNIYQIIQALKEFTRRFI